MSNKRRKKRIVFLTGTRADFGKLKSIIKAATNSNEFEVHIFATGMHMNQSYGYTVHEIVKARLPNLYKFINHSDGDRMDTILANTIHGLGNYTRSIEPDMIIVHGDRVEALAGAFVGAFNNILVSHIEGGEVSGTIDEHIRHSISKMAHIHFVANERARKRLIQMGEDKDKIFTIGSPDIDIMKSKSLPGLAATKKRYGITFSKYALLVHHSVTTEVEKLRNQTKIMVNSILNSSIPYITIYPNNDPGTDIIKRAYDTKLTDTNRFKMFPSIRFEHFLTLLKNAHFIIGNSSAGIREAPFYGVPAINIGNRQRDRIDPAHLGKCVVNCAYDADELDSVISRYAKKKYRFAESKNWGTGDSKNRFLKILKSKQIWSGTPQKRFWDINFVS